MDMNDSFDKAAIVLLDDSIGSLKENNIIEVIIKKPVKPSKYRPLSGSFAKE